MRWLFSFSTVLLLSAWATALPAQETQPVVSGKAPSAEEILKKADDVTNSYDDMFVTSLLTVIDRDGTEKVREMRVWQKGDKRLVKFVQPASERGIALLATDPETNYVYLPAYKKVRRVAAHARNQTFLGTDFTQEDMGLTRFSDRYTPSLFGETDTHWVLELAPKPGRNVGYGKLQIQVNKDRYTVERIEYFDSSGEAIKVEERSEFGLHEGKHWTAAKLRVINLKDNHQTVVKQQKFQFDQGLGEDFFSTRNLMMPVR